MIFISWLCLVPQSGVSVSLLLSIFGSGSSAKPFQSPLHFCPFIHTDISKKKTHNYK